MIDYNKRLVELDEILNYLEYEYYEKIPKDVIQVIKDNKDRNYTWSYDEAKELKDQDVSKDTIAILSYINMEYLLNEEQKKVMQKIHDFNEKKMEAEKATEYHEKNIFQNKTQKIEQSDVNKNQILVYKENFLSNIITKIKGLFKK